MTNQQGQSAPVRSGSTSVALPFLLVTLIWGSTWIVIKDQLAVVPPSWSVTYRFALGAFVMFALAIWRGDILRLPRSSVPFVCAFGALQFSANFNLVYEAEHYIASGLVALLFALLFVPNAIFAAIFLRQRVSPRFMAGSAVAIGGLAMLFGQELQAAGGKDSASAIGLMLTLAAVLTASAANVMQASRTAQRLPVMALLAWGMTAGALANAAYALWYSGPPVLEWRAGYFLGVGFLAVMATALAFILYSGLLRTMGPARAAYVNVLVPVLAMGWSTLLEGYRWTPLAASGCAIALIGMVIALGSATQAREDSKAKTGSGA